MDKNSRIYIAGHTGLVGSALMAKLSAKGFVNIVTRTHSELELDNQAKTESFFAEEHPEYVFHAAAKMGGLQTQKERPADFLYSNVMIASNVIHAAYKYGVKKLLYIGISWAYPNAVPQPICEESLMSAKLEKTNEAYGIAKITGIKLCEYYNRQYGTNFISCMPGNLYGIGDKFDPAHSHVIPALIRKFREADPDGTVVIWGDGTLRREFLYIDDMADVCLFLMEHYNGLETINVGTGEEVSIKQLAEKIAEISGFKGNMIYDISKPNGAPRKLLDCTKLLSLGWKPTVSLDEGLRLVYESYKNKE